MKRFALLAVPFALIACGDNNDEQVRIDAATDAVVVDAANIDAPTDARDIDAPPAITYSGTISVFEAKLLNPTGAPTLYFGQGVQIGISFSSSDTTVFPGPVMETDPGSPLGCKAWSYTRTQAIASSIGLDEGAVRVNATAGTNRPMYPPCTFTANVGYTCPHVDTFSTGGIIGPGPVAGTATLTDLDTSFNANNTSNRYVNISGATNPSNNGTFPIVALGGANTIVYGNPGFVAETVPATGAHVNLAGVGPTPSAPDPGFLSDDIAMNFMLTPGGGSHFPAFTAATATTVGADFVLPVADSSRLNALPNDGTAFTFTCDGASCAAGSASGTLINIVTTDAPTAGLSPFAMPLPTTRRAQVRCAALGMSTITVPAAYSAFLMGSGATRIQATLIRPVLMPGGPQPVNAISGHAIVGFTNR